ncbi:phage head closure protein [uncultured Duncaniella sp.]|jgi:SPP1 family predicted phage head-tail adaptor|uniref:phage head closure protein n=1 Tax=uncultured Duncaniella sp. TaxID=2768039 RepID=UPI0026EBEA93|nr:phage head closure protein [uncultured Duncaniella sp.]
MKAGRLNTFITPMHLTVTHDAVTGEARRVWEELPEIRAERVKYTARHVYNSAELVVGVDAVFHIRYAHPVRDGWRVRERGGDIYDVVVEPNREKQLKLLRCTKVND